MQHSGSLAYYGVIDTPLTKLEVYCDERINCMRFVPEDTSSKKLESHLRLDIIEQITAYMKGDLKSFDLPIHLKGTPFQENVWQALMAIPYGTTLTYGELAANLNTHPRAIGMACRQNPIPLIVPCHRIVGKGHIGGFVGKTTGFTIDIKEKLLDLERH